MFVDDSGNLLCMRARSTGRIWPWLILFCWQLVPQRRLWFFSSSRHRSLLLIFTGSHFVLSTATIPRRPRGWTPAWQRRRSPRRSARTEVCVWTSPLKHTANSINRCTCIYIRPYLCSICSTLHDPSLHMLPHV